MNDERKLSIDERLRRSTNPVFEDIYEERQRQDLKWGQQNHDPFTWLTILGEEFGEASKAALTWRFAPAAKWFLAAAEQDEVERGEYRAELIQIAAVAVAMVECLDRNENDWPWTASPYLKGTHDE